MKSGLSRKTLLYKIGRSASKNKKKNGFDSFSEKKMGSNSPKMKKIG